MNLANEKQLFFLVADQQTVIELQPDLTITLFATAGVIVVKLTIELIFVMGCQTTIW
jgi:hypothetical protein